MEKNKKRKIPWSNIYLLATIIIVVAFCAVNQQFSNLGKIFSHVTVGFTVLAFTLLIIYILFEGWIVYYLMRKQGESVSFGCCMKISLIGLYYSYITPSSTGGQPAQVAYLKKYNVSVGSSVAVLFIKFFAFETSFVLCSIFSLVMLYGKIEANLFTLAVIGTCINAVWIVLIPLLFSKKILDKLCQFLTFLTNKIKLIKNKEKYLGSIEHFQSDFTLYTEKFKNNKRSVVISCLLSIPQFICQMGVLYFVYRSFGYSEASFVEITEMQTLLQAAVAYMPLPGASGAQEIGFSSFFNRYFVNNDLIAAIMVWRFITYYIIVIAGAALVLVDTLLLRRKALKKV
jgi:uncharacterized protein (TIRG00374 family)